MCSAVVSRCSTRTTFLFLVAFLVVLILIYNADLNRLLYSRPPGSVRSIPVEFLYPDRERATTERRYSVDGNLVGYVWPVPGSLKNRIRNQVNYVDEYASRRGDNLTRKKIILRVGDFNFEDWVEGQELLVQQQCPITDCWFTTDRSVSELADALLISEFDRSRLSLYTPKPAHQIWIAKHMESPMHNRIDPRSLGNLVNWSVSYRPESTIAAPYGSWEMRNASNSQNLLDINYAKGKTKKVAWFVSNCADKNGRLHYANELKKHIDVDIYGACGTLSCPTSGGDVDCRAMLKKDYKFYLAFENSNCVGYITEKFHWNALV